MKKQLFNGELIISRSQKDVSSCCERHVIVAVLLRADGACAQQPQNAIPICKQEVTYSTTNKRLTIQDVSLQLINIILH